MNDESVKFVF